MRAPGARVRQPVGIGLTARSTACAYTEPTG